MQVPRVLPAPSTSAYSAFRDSSRVLGGEGTGCAFGSTQECCSLLWDEHQLVFPASERRCFCFWGEHQVGAKSSQTQMEYCKNTVRISYFKVHAVAILIVPCEDHTNPSMTTMFLRLHQDSVSASYTTAPDYMLQDSSGTAICRQTQEFEPV
jgi:hypothetical protein